MIITNGNYEYDLSLIDGTKIRYSPIGKRHEPIYPESIDLKITNYCNGGCAFCHENSTIQGRNADHDFLIGLLDELPSYTELAIGGGNPLDYPYLKELLSHRSDLVYNLTINAKHLYMFEEHLDQYVKAIGISYSRHKYDSIKAFVSKYKNIQTVIHLIAGVDTVDDFKQCLKDFDRVLILGYKHVGRGKSYFTESVIHTFNDWLKIGYNYPNKVIAFDNLAIEQLRVARFFNEENWDRLYMGDDGNFTMYIDAVNKQFAISSRDLHKYNCTTIKKDFSFIQNNLIYN